MIEPLGLDANIIQASLINNLVVSNAITSKQQALIEQSVTDKKTTHIQALKRFGFVSEDFLLENLAIELDWSLAQNTQDCPLVADVLSLATQQSLSIDWCIEQGVFATANEQSCNIYVVDPFNQFAISVIISNITQANVNYILLTSAMMANIVDELTREREVSDLFGQKGINLSTLAEEAPVINLVNSFLEKAIQLEASDIHIEAGDTNMRVRFRIDGTLMEHMRQPISRFAAISSRIKLLAELDIAERRLPQDGRFSTRNAGQDFDIRVSTAPDVYGESIVMRLLPKKREQLSLANLGFAPDHLSTIQRWGKLSNGIVLVTGPTGSGKSTTLYGLLSDLRTGKEKIVTVEDPVEYQLEGVTQVQARADIGYTFAKALRTFLRQDPDVIMVGEIRDKETADIAVQSSLTGHLVLSTLHTNDACSVFPRLTDMGVEPFLIAATIQGVQAQRLVKKLCEHCAESTDAPSFMPEASKEGTWRKAVGCPKCHGKGYKGRIGIYELVEVTPALRELISAGAGVAKLRLQAKQDGARNLFNDGLLKAAQGITSVEEVLRVCATEDEVI
ncbi:GspE/PulE family protein [Brumicola nitratireducens]|uniref:Type II secretion system protein E n=1 Tax=Glaciecola nitratireducens (strain JCM 12485 / KCTC 12276 / FR1064) TaxID=1085623 RepID=G4QIP8_GLANF|nr:GspE/PulE family protein [Glaciecola nitratireducens]AEP31203.1 type II secretion system protein E [Glaciecola nitratireducens FR1064]